MNTDGQIQNYISGLPGAKRSDMQDLHKFILDILPGCRLWFLDGRDPSGKIVSNPNIGYGLRTIKYANGSEKEFYQVGISANTSGISTYILGIDDKNYLPATYGSKIGKAKVTGYCIQFKGLKDINLAILETAIRDGIQHTS